MPLITYISSSDIETDYAIEHNNYDWRENDSNGILITADFDLLIPGLGVSVSSKSTVIRDLTI